MSSTATTKEVMLDEARAYLAAVRAHLSDLPDNERDELLEDLEQHLLEVAAETGEPLAQRLGPPADYAAELRSSAGLPERAETATSQGFLRSTRGRAQSRAQRVWTQVQANELARPVLAFLPQLRPAWWVLRAWLFLALLAVFSGDSGSWTSQVPFPFGGIVGVLLLPLAVVASVRLGQRMSQNGPWGRRQSLSVRALNGVTGLFAVTILLDTLGGGAALEHQVIYQDVPAESASIGVLSHPDGEPISNIYVYDRDGEPVNEVLLYDGRGRPIELGEPERLEQVVPDVTTEYAFTRFGEPVTNLFPLRQFVREIGPDGQERLIARPAPEVSLPALPPSIFPGRPTQSPSALESPGASESASASAAEPSQSAPARASEPVTEGGAPPAAAAPPAGESASEPVRPPAAVELTPAPAGAPPPPTG